MSKKRVKNPIKARGNALYFNFSFKGREIRSTTGYKVGQEKLALEAYLAKLQELEDESNGLQLHRNIQDGLLRWIDEKQPTLVKPRAYNTHLKVIREYIDETQPLTEIYRITNKMVVDMQQAMKIDKVSGEPVRRYKNASINRKTAILKSMANLAYSQWNWLKESPYKRITQLSEKSSVRDTFIEPHEVEALANACESKAIHDLTIFTAYTGLRTGELWRLNAQSLRGDVLHIDGKGDKLRAIPLDASQVAFVEQYVPFTFTEEHAKGEFLQARKTCGLMHYTFHDLRHTFGTLMAKAGVPQYKIMALMGHSTDAMVRRYLKLSVDDLRGDMPARPPVPPASQSALSAVT